ncbi:hypothetical protein [Mycobacterium hubeiense]|nr:hypothetical protein [Mycobacterium sp. QGD 101]
MTAEDYVRQVRIACEDLFDDPSDESAWTALLELHAHGVPARGPLNCRG